MRRILYLLAVLLLALAPLGCNEGKLRTRGRIVKNDAPFTVEETDFVRIMFVPIPEGTEKVLDYHVAVFNKTDGTFVASGKDGEGVPPGKYRISIEHLRNKQDLFGGAYSTERSPFVREVKTSSDRLTLDLAKPG